MSLQNWLKQTLNPPGIRSENRGALYRIIGRIGDVLASDIRSVQRDFFPLTTTKLSEHGEATQIPRFPYDTDESYSRRLASGSLVLDTTGERLSLEIFLESYVPSRWLIQDFPKEAFRINYSAVGRAAIGGDPRLLVRVVDMTEQEKSNIEDWLSWFLGADIDFAVLNYSYMPPENLLTLQDLRERGGGTWLEGELRDIANTRVDIMPDEAFRVGLGIVGLQRIYEGGEGLIIVCPIDFRSSITQRLDLILESSVSRVISEREEIL